MASPKPITTKFQSNKESRATHSKILTPRFTTLGDGSIKETSSPGLIPGNVQILNQFFTLRDSRELTGSVFGGWTTLWLTASSWVRAPTRARVVMQRSSLTSFSFAIYSHIHSRKSVHFLLESRRKHFFCPIISRSHSKVKQATSSYLSRCRQLENLTPWENLQASNTFGAASCFDLMQSVSRIAAFV